LVRGRQQAWHSPGLAVAGQLLARKPRKLTAVALGNKTARIVWGDGAQ
jgi:hypothetical protein